ncbi:hypothetical protein ACFOLA_06895 [Salinicoccus hispanicus]|uniref:Phosphagen kinase C-terminal domain-containing protein n=2 Tax=Salinicoccus hispanicus TaxID=157225 RepID=A0A6N8U173_9STAP|nr:hypothetical protein [Salinicoccus hispanicus]
MEYSHISPWMHNVEELPVEMSTRVRLARNISNLPFPHMMNDDAQLKPVLDRLDDTLTGYRRIQMDTLQFEDKALMVEKHLISPLFTKRGLLSYINEEESISIMVNEEDHLRIQTMGVGMSLMSLYNKANEIDDEIESEVGYAFDDQYGYLTACPTNIGTGLRASVMLHLPAMTFGSRIQTLAANLSRFGFTLRGIYGEGSIPLGHIYQLSNQLTLGQTEEEIISNLDELKERIVEEEIEMRSQFKSEHLIEVKDSVYRSYGILKHAFKLPLKEAAKCLSDIKLGIDLELIEHEDFQFQKWIQLIQPAFIKMRLNEQNKEIASLERAVEEERAALMRQLLGGE